MPDPYVQASYHGGPGNSPPVRLVIHATCPNLGYPHASAAGQAASTARFFAGPEKGGSAHRVFDIAGGVRCLPDDTEAFHAPPNLHSLGYEICAESTYTREQWLSPQVWPAVERCAAQVRADLVRYGLPGRRLTVAQVAAGEHGVCGHVDVSQAFRQSDHTDPGPGFPWDRFLALLTGSTPALTKDEFDMASLDDLRTIVREEIASARALDHAEHALLLHGDKDHPASLDSIAATVGAPGTHK